MKKITACIDLGNTRQKAAIFEGNQLKQEIDLSNNLIQDVASLLSTFQPSNIILSSVIDHPEALEKILSEKSCFHKLSVNSKMNFNVDVEKRETVGVDRLAVCAAAVHYYPGSNNLVISLGSCITYNFINQYNSFLGGAIAPGMNMRFRALHEYTAKLPLVSPDDHIIGLDIPLLGYNTVTNIKSGVINGMICEIDGIIDRYSERYGNFNVLLTGGNSTYFAGQLKNKIFADSTFLFKGLYVLSEINNQAN